LRFTSCAGQTLELRCNWRRCSLEIGARSCYTTHPLYSSVLYIWQSDNPCSCANEPLSQELTTRRAKLIPTPRLNEGRSPLRVGCENYKRVHGVQVFNTEIFPFLRRGRIFSQDTFALITETAWKFTFSLSRAQLPEESAKKRETAPFNLPHRVSYTHKSVQFMW
jgi:hypothetical protein